MRAPSKSENAKNTDVIPKKCKLDEINQESSRRSRNNAASRNSASQKPEKCFVKKAAAAQGSGGHSRVAALKGPAAKSMRPLSAAEQVMHTSSKVALVA